MCIGMNQPSTQSDELLQHVLEQSAARHSHLCPRQVLGVRMGMYAMCLLELLTPTPKKRLFAFVETDGCFVDGVEVATGCSLGHRTLRLIDYGKVAATFVDTCTDQAVRLAPHPQSRQTALLAEPCAKSRWHAQLAAYQTLHDEDLFVAQSVQISLDLRAIISRPGVRINCDLCGEEIINEREVHIEHQTLCRSCADGAYFHAPQKLLKDT